MIPSSSVSLVVDEPSDVKKVERVFYLKKMILNKYKTLIFDCDGVILNSNQLKTKGFF